MKKGGQAWDAHAHAREVRREPGKKEARRGMHMHLYELAHELHGARAVDAGEDMEAAVSDGWPGDLHAFARQLALQPRRRLFGR